MQQYLIYAGIALAGWAIRHFNIGPDLSKFPILSILFQIVEGVVGNQTVPMVPASPLVPGASAGDVANVVAPAPAVLLATEVDHALLPLVKQIKDRMIAKANAELASVLDKTVSDPVPQSEVKK